MDGPHLVLDLAQIRSDARDGKLAVEQLLDLIDKAHQTIRRLEADKRRLAQRLAQYEPEAASEAASSPTNTNPPTPNASYSLDAENQRRQGRRRRKKSPGRTPTEVKFTAADQLEDIYPDNVRRGDCQLVRERAVWRLLDGKAVRVGYCHRAPQNQPPLSAPKPARGLGIYGKPPVDRFASIMVAGTLAANSAALCFGRLAPTSSMGSRVS